MTIKNFTFALAEDTPRFDRLTLVARCAFTLAEVLITLIIVGIVAAMTIPSLVAKINQKISENRQEVIEKRLLDGLNRYNTVEDGLSQHYETTYDFLTGLSKHYKMAQICKANEITNCIPYSTINYTQDGEDNSIEVSTLTSIDSFMSEGKDNYLEPASFITAQGIPVIMAFKKNCVWDSEKAMRDIADSGCIAYMYDESGTRNPNKLGKDIITHGLSIVSGNGNGTVAEIATIGGYKIMEKAFFPSNGLSQSDCEAEMAKNYGITECQNMSGEGGDRWVAGMKYCHDKGWRIPKKKEMKKIVDNLFYEDEDEEIIFNFDLARTIGLKSYTNTDIKEGNRTEIGLWLDTSYSTNNSRANTYYFDTDNTAVSAPAERSNGNYQVICISD